MTVRRLAIEPDAPFSLAAVASFGFRPNTGRPKPHVDGADRMSLAFALDGYTEHAGVAPVQRRARMRS